MFTTYLQKSIETLLALKSKIEPGIIEDAVNMCVATLRKNNPLMVCGNGGSAADAMHITGELVGRFKRERRGINALCLTSNSAFLTAWSNDYDYDTIFSRQVEAYGKDGGVVMGLSTSGNSPSVVRAFEQAATMGLPTIALTGEGGGRLKPLSTICLEVPSSDTPHIQEGHICIYHYLCAAIEERL